MLDPAAPGAEPTLPPPAPEDMMVESADWFGQKFSLTLCGHKFGASAAKQLVIVLAAIAVAAVVALVITVAGAPPPAQPQPLPAPADSGASLGGSAAAGATADGANIAANKPVLADSSLRSFGAELAVDGDHSTDASRWVSEGDSPQHWLALDLQQYYRLNRVQIYAGYEQATHFGLCSHTVSCWAGDLDADLEAASASDTGWTDIISHGEETTEMEHLDFTSISCRLVKLSIDQSTCASRSEWSDFTRVYEFEIYGQLAPEPTGRSRGKNIALNKPVLSDSAYGPNLSSCGSKDASMCVAERAVDGDTTSQQSRWLSTADDSSHWLVIDLQVQKIIPTCNRPAFVS